MDKQKDLAKANSAFAWDVYSALLQIEKSSNTFFSPYSISSVLHMIYFGAKGNTLQQLAETLHLKDVGVEKMECDYVALCEQINGLNSPAQNGITLRSANGVFAEQSFNFHKDYVDRLKNLHVEYGQCDFRNNAEGVRKDVNAWVDKQTASKIRNILPSGSVDTSTQMILVNAIYFKGSWLDEFKIDNTKKCEFHLLNGSTCSVDIMYQNESFASFHDSALGAILVKLPFGKGNRSPASMVIILPDKFDGLPLVEAALKSPNALRLDECKLKPTKLYLPKLRMESTLPLGALLRKMGITDLFDPNAANLSGMTKVDGLFVADGFHKALLDIDEKGAVAVAASGAFSIHDTCYTPEITIRVDHPFALLIVDQETGSILFMGRVLEP